jgi:hypothetical protein
VETFFSKAKADLRGKGEQKHSSDVRGAKAKAAQ